MLVHHEVGIDRRAEEVIAIWTLLNSPSEVGLVTMGVTIPNADLGCILSSTTMDMGNCMGGTLADNPNLSAASGEAVRVCVRTRVHRNKSPMEIGLTDVLPLGNGGIISSSSTMNVYTGARVNERKRPETTSNIPKVDLQISLVSMGISVPQGNFTTVVVVRAMLVHHEAWVDGRLNEKGSIGSRSKSPLQIALVSVGVSIPTTHFSTIKGLPTMNMSNRTKLALEEEVLSSVKKIVG